MVASENEVNRGDEAHSEQRVNEIDSQSDFEEVGQSGKRRRTVREEENENDDRGEDFEHGSVKPSVKEFGHGHHAELLGHPSRSVSQDEPGQETAEEGISGRDPEDVKAEPPAELAGEADEHDGRVVTGTIGESGDPRTKRTPADEKVAKCLGFFHSPNSDPNRQKDKNRD